MRAASEPCRMLNLFEHERADTHAVKVRMDRYLLHKQRPHPALLEVPMVHPAICAADLMGIFCIPNQLEFFPAIDFEEQLLDAFIFIGLHEALLVTWTLEFDCLAVHTAKHHLEKLPHAIDIAAMHAADVQLDPVARSSIAGDRSAWHIVGGVHRHLPA